jgi:hypothetical protein
MGKVFAGVVSTDPQGVKHTDYRETSLAYGVSRSALSEMCYDDLSGRWDTMGFRYEEVPDWANNCTGARGAPQPDYGPQANQTTGPHFLVKYLEDGGTSDLIPKFTNYLQRNMASSGVLTSDFGSIIPRAHLSASSTPQPGQVAECPDPERAGQRRRHLYRFLDGKSECTVLSRQVGRQAACGLDRLRPLEITYLRGTRQKRCRGLPPTTPLVFLSRRRECRA